LAVRCCYFHGHADGISSDPSATSRILIEYSEFGQAGFGNGYSHNMYLGSEALGAIAKVSAWINLFNLIPIPPLDGGRGFRALGNQQRMLCAAVLGALYAFTHLGFVGIIAVIALFAASSSAKTRARIAAF
jgi:Zn-dependent protease